MKRTDIAWLVFGTCVFVTVASAWLVGVWNNMHV